MAELAILLELNPSKMFIIPIDSKLDDKTRNCIRRYLCCRAPEWSEVPIQSAGKYLGFYVGPKGDCLNWHAAAEGWFASSQLVIKAKLTANMAVLAYNSRCVTKLSYLLQILEPPPELIAAERQLIH
eukprot:11864672-Karenia_brevis.AAC.1